MVIRLSIISTLLKLAGNEEGRMEIFISYVIFNTVAVLVAAFCYFILPDDLPYWLWGNCPTRIEDEELRKQKRIGCIIGLIAALIINTITYFVCK